MTKYRWQGSTTGASQANPLAERPMRKRYTDKTRKVISLACSAAQHAGVPEVGPDYLLLGIAHYGEYCLANAILQHLDVSLDAYAESFRQRQAQIPNFTSELSDVFAEMASNEAHELGHNYVGTEHFLLAIMRSDSAASKYLRNVGINHQRLREETLAALG